ncbi:TraR/DksA C4-type zinc finger protein [Pantoea ananatis]
MSAEWKMTQGLNDELAKAALRDIPPARQRAVPGVLLCTGCQEVSDEKAGILQPAAEAKR